MNRIQTPSRGTRASSYRTNRTRPTIQPLERRVLLSSAINPMQLTGFTWLGHNFSLASQTSPVTVPVTTPTPSTPSVGAVQVTSTAPSQDSVNGLQGQYSVPGYVSADITISSGGFHLLGPQTLTRFSVTGRNIFDHRYSEPAFGGFDVPIQGRNVMFGIQQQL